MDTVVTIAKFINAISLMFLFLIINAVAWVSSVLMLFFLERPVLLVLALVAFFYYLSTIPAYE